MKIRNRLLLLLSAFTALAALAIDLTASGLLDRAVRERAMERLRAESSLLARQVELAWPTSVSSGDLWADEAGAALGLRVTLIDPNGDLLGDSRVSLLELPGLENHLHRPEVIEAGANGFGISTRHSTSIDRDMVYLARRIGPPGSPRGYLRLALPDSELRTVSRGYRLLLTGISLLALALLVGVAYVMIRRLSRPIEDISETADRVASGDYHLVIQRDAEGEIGGLTAAVDRMRRSLLVQIAHTEAQRGLLASILGGLREGILVVNRDRRVVLVNDAFRQTFGVASMIPEGTPMIEVVRERAILDTFDEALAAGEDISRRVAIPGGRSFELTVVPFASESSGRGGAIGLLFEVTRLDALERIRKEFVADISHELRTPLASLKASLETLMGGALSDPAAAPVFLDMVTRNAMRIEVILEDLTDLSLIETGAVVLSIEPVRLEAAVRDVMIAMKARAAARSVTMLSTVPQDLVISGDRRRLDQILTNLVDNAIKFNREGGQVTVSAHALGARIRLTVEDTGPGIPPDALDRIFNRFFRVDRARKYEASGSGLGLAIVKHLVHLHHGNILAENRESGGTRFVVDLPAAN